jgi:hypothetical protein
MAHPEASKDARHSSSPTAFLPSTVAQPIPPRRSWYSNLDRVTADGDHEAVFHLRQPQPALIALLASGYSLSRDEEKERQLVEISQRILGRALKADKRNCTDIDQYALS